MFVLTHQMPVYRPIRFLYNLTISNIKYYPITVNIPSYIFQKNTHSHMPIQFVHINIYLLSTHTYMQSVFKVPEKSHTYTNSVLLSYLICRTFQVKTSILDLIVNSVNEATPNMAHFLCGYNLSDVQDTNIQHAGMYLLK